MSKESDFVKAYKKFGKPQGRKRNIQGKGDASSLKRGERAQTSGKVGRR